MNRIIQEDIADIIGQPIAWEKMQGAKILLTGASGMLGQYLLLTLLELNRQKSYDIDIYALVRHPQKLEDEVREKVHVIQQSVVDPIDTDVDFDYVLHTASPASPRIMKDDPVGTIAANTLGAWNTLQIAQKSKAKGYLFISSREIYGEPYEEQEFFTEDTYGRVDPLDPRSSYPEGKKAAETMCASFRHQYGLNTKVARLAHTLGPGMSIDDGRVQADFLRDIVNHRDIVMKSEGTAIRTYTYVADAVSGIWTILLNSPDEEMVYNISSENAIVSIRQLAEAMIDAVPERDLKLVMDIPDTKAAGVAPFTRGILSSKKLMGLGWSPKHELIEGIRRTVAYIEGE